MDDIMGKIQEVLSDEESMKQLSELAELFSSSGEDEAVHEEKSEQDSSGSPFGDFDFTKMLKVGQIMGAASNDKNAELLLALKPLLKEERQEKVDRAVKMLKLFAVWNVLKDSGLLQDFL